jgi:ABC-2 type transport system permease protein
MAVVAYEQRRISTIRSTWVILAVTVALAGGLAALTAALSNIDSETGQRGAPATMDTVLSSVSNPIVLVPISVLAAMAFGGEYRFGLIRQTLTAFPRRTSVFLAKLWVSVLWMAAFLLLAAVVVLAVSFLFKSNLVFEPFTATNLAVIGRSILFGIGYSLFAFALVVMTRNQALSIVIVILWALLVETIITGFLGSRYEWLPKVLPMTSGSGFVGGEDVLRNGMVFGAWLLVFLLVAWVLLLRRDA